MRVEVLGGVERRRRWSQDDKARIVEKVGPCFTPVQITAAVEPSAEDAKPLSKDDRRSPCRRPGTD